MIYEEANSEAKKLFEEWVGKRELIIKNAKEIGVWLKCGLDSNQYLFKELDEEVRNKLETLRNNICD